MEEDKSEVDPKYILDLPLAYPSLKFHSNYQLDSQLIWLEFEPYTSTVNKSGKFVVDEYQRTIDH